MNIIPALKSLPTPRLILSFTLTIERLADTIKRWGQTRFLTQSRPRARNHLQDNGLTLPTLPKTRLAVATWILFMLGTMPLYPAATGRLIPSIQEMTSIMLIKCGILSQIQTVISIITTMLIGKPRQYPGSHYYAMSGLGWLTERAIQRYTTTRLL